MGLEADEFRTTLKHTTESSKHVSFSFLPPTTPQVTLGYTQEYPSCYHCPDGHSRLPLPYPRLLPLQGILYEKDIFFTFQNTNHLALQLVWSYQQFNTSLPMRGPSPKEELLESQGQQRCQQTIVISA